MKALVLKGPKQPFVMEDVPDPTPEPGEAVARIFACGSGLTIQHVKAGRVPVDFPRIIGHEFTGEIAAVGKGVTNIAAGDPVTSYFYLNCGYCKWCRSNLEPLCENSGGHIGRECDGAYAQFIKLPAQNFIKLPEGLDYKKHPAEVGVITDAIATPYKVLKRAQITAKDTVAVFGAGGGLGLQMVLMAKWARARVIAVDVVADKFPACLDAGADDCVDASRGNVAEALMDLTNGQGIDVAVDFVSSTATLEAGAGALGRAGRLVTLGGAGEDFQASAKAMLVKELSLLGSRYVTKQEVVDCLELAARGEFWPVVTDIRTWNEAEEIHELVESGLVTGRAALLIE